MREARRTRSPSGKDLTAGRPSEEEGHPPSSTHDRHDHRGVLRRERTAALGAEDDGLVAHRRLPDHLVRLRLIEGLWPPVADEVDRFSYASQNVGVAQSIKRRSSTVLNRMPGAGTGGSS